MRFFKVAAALVAVFLADSALASPAVSYTNPLANQRADPHITKHTDGWYYFTGTYAILTPIKSGDHILTIEPATVPEFDKIVLRRAQTIQGLSTAAETTIWRRKASGVGSGQVWAPELHYIDGKWYIYVALGVSGKWQIRAFVLEGTGANPLAANWVEKGLVKTNWDTFSLDMSTFAVNGTRYLVWAQQEPSRSDENSSLMLAPAANPWTIRGTAIAISRPTLSWERIGYKVNEGAAVIQKNGKIFLTYSASATDFNYCMGLLTASADANLMNAASWSKSSTPIFTSNDNTKQYGPGHNSFTVSEDGLSDIMVYHDRSYKEIKGDPLNDPNRRTRVQKLYWKADGTPDFGIPIPDGPTPIRLRSSVNSNVYVRATASGQANSGTASLPDTQVRVVPGLAGNNSVSLESASRPGTYLRRANSSLRWEAKSNAATFAADASFIQRAGLADASGISFEGYNAPSSFVSLLGDSTLAMSLADTAEQRGLSTLYAE